MEEYYFLFGLALAYIIFASIQDLKTREVANWLTFSLILFGLVYRGAYALVYSDPWFFLWGLFGLGTFVVLGYAAYYGRVFAGGDAKLLMGMGVILPISSFNGLFLSSFVYLFLLFTFGAIYSVGYSVFLVAKNFGKFKKRFTKKIHEERYTFILPVVAVTALFFFVGFGAPFVLFSFLVLLLPLLYVYLKALEGSAMIKQISASKLTEGDWLEKDVRIGRKTIAKSVHGLSIEEILLLRRAGRKVWIKEGIPFVPAFLLSFVFLLVVFLVYGISYENLLQVFGKVAMNIN